MNSETEPYYTALLILKVVIVTGSPLKHGIYTTAVSTNARSFNKDLS